MYNYFFKLTAGISRKIALTAVITAFSVLLPNYGYSQATSINLGTAADFAVLAAAGISNTGNTLLTGDIGSYPSETITGFPPGIYTGVNHGGDAVTQSAMVALHTAYLDALSRTGAVQVNSELGSTSKTPGVYSSASGTFTITGNLTLDAQNNPNAVFIFQMGTTLTTAVSSKVLLVNGAQWSNVYWQVGSSATLGSTSVFEGTILANTSISSNGTTMRGRLLAGAVTATGAVVLNNDQALPVEMTSFTASVKEGAVELVWTTATEINNYGYEVQRSSPSLPESIDQSHKWTKIGFVAGSGNSNAPKRYTFADKTAAFGRYSYRLKQIDTNGDFEYSEIVELFTGQMPNGFILHQNYPNPFNPVTVIQFGADKSTYATLTVFNAIGELVEVLYDGYITAGQILSVRFNGENNTGGIFYYKLMTKDNKLVKKMILIK